MEKETKQKISKVLTILSTVILIIAAIIFITNFFKSCNNFYSVREQTNLNNAVNDSMRYFKLRDSLNRSEKLTIVTSNVKDLLEIKTKDVQLQKLQKLVAEYKSELKKGSGITTFGSTTTVDTVYSKPIVKYANTFWKDSIKDKWIDWRYSVKLDTVNKINKISFKLALENEYAIINKEKSNGWFKKPTPYTEIINYNPYTKTKSQISYKVSSEVRNKRIGIGPNVSYGIGGNFQTQVFIGVGVQYNVIKF